MYIVYAYAHVQMNMTRAQYIESENSDTYDYKTNPNGKKKSGTLRCYTTVCHTIIYYNIL